MSFLAAFWQFLKGLATGKVIAGGRRWLRPRRFILLRTLRAGKSRGQSAGAHLTLAVPHTVYVDSPHPTSQSACASYTARKNSSEKREGAPALGWRRALSESGHGPDPGNRWAEGFTDRPVARHQRDGLLPRQPSASPVVGQYESAPLAVGPRDLDQIALGVG